MSSFGDINTRVGPARTPGSNTQLIINTGGVQGASPNLTFDGVNLTTVNLIIATNATTRFIQTYNVTSNSLDFIWV